VKFRSPGLHVIHLKIMTLMKMFAVLALYLLQLLRRGISEHLLLKVFLEIGKTFCWRKVSLNSVMFTNRISFNEYYVPISCLIRFARKLRQFVFWGACIYCLVGPFSVSDVDF
jgi:hypothetical protein